jgi:hypothetical protein
MVLPGCWLGTVGGEVRIETDGKLMRNLGEAMVAQTWLGVD